MQEGWFRDDYLILFGESEIEAASQRYGLSDYLPEHRLRGLVGWDDFLVRDASGQILRIPTVPLVAQYLEPYELAENTPPLEPDARFTGQIKWYVKPIVFGGDPRVGSNLVWVSHTQHAQLVLYWNQFYRWMTPATKPPT
jgi:hypothetical protein